jgi:hypothetical protein
MIGDVIKGIKKRKELKMADFPTNDEIENNDEFYGDGGVREDVRVLVGSPFSFPFFSIVGSTCRR